ncbi:hypothetical protein LCGC14_0502690, partial [marine sediment metagenome]
IIAKFDNAHLKLYPGLLFKEEKNF